MCYKNKLQLKMSLPHGIGSEVALLVRTCFHMITFSRPMVTSLLGMNPIFNLTGLQTSNNTFLL